MNVSPRRLLKVVAPLMVVALLLFGAIHVQAVTDYIRLIGYQAPPDVAALADDDTMTAAATRLFYVNHPAIDGRSSFNGECANNSEKTIVLGCYHPVDRGIYIFAVNDSRLRGVEQVTAAHEMLHAAYDRLSTSERKTIDAELQDFYAHHVTDQRIKDVMAAYQKSEPNDVTNEMHSIFGTEISQLTPQLEQYYSRYFTNRMKVVDYANGYQQEFQSRQDEIKQYDAELTTLKQEIDNNTAELKQQQADITAMQQEMDQQRKHNDVDAYNANVPVYNAKVDAYNGLLQKTKDDISQYNNLVKQRNSIASEVQQLMQSIDSKFSPIGQ